MAAKIHVGDIGCVFKVRIVDENDAAIDVSNADVLTIIFRKPRGNVTTKEASLVNDGTDGYIQYTSETNDLDQAGRWQIQGYVEIGEEQFHTDTASFRVKPNLN